MSFFFFSSRRRHTRSYGDWSSDVCSSDLEQARIRVQQLSNKAIRGCVVLTGRCRDIEIDIDTLHADIGVLLTNHRSEERRVGKECRSRGAAEHLKEKEK